jgi:hypothetical protein
MLRLWKNFIDIHDIGTSRRRNKLLVLSLEEWRVHQPDWRIVTACHFEGW